MVGLSRAARAVFLALGLIGCSVAQASGGVLKNDGFANDTNTCQMGFAAGETAGAGFAAPPSAYPIRIDSIQFLNCASSSVSLDIYPDDLDSTPAPEGAALWTSPSSVPVIPGFQTIDVSDQHIVIPSSGIRVGITGVGDGAKVATDNAAIVPQHNSIFTGGNWNFAETFAFTKNFIIRAGYTSLGQPRITKHPKATVKTKHRHVLVEFRFKSSSTDAGHECRLDFGRFKQCSSPQLYRAGIGSHRFQVRNDLDGDAGKATSYRFKVVHKD